MSSLLSDEITVKIANKDKVKGKTVGLNAVKAALSAFNPVSGIAKHRGKSSSKTNDYLIYRLTNAEGTTMRLFIHLENAAEGKQICDIKIRLS